MHRVYTMLAVLFVIPAHSSVTMAATIVHDQNAGNLQVLAAREVQRYVYLRTGELLAISAKPPKNGDAIIIATDDSLKPQQYKLHSQAGERGKTLQITGGSDLSALHGAYSFAERLGVRFYVHGDVVPDRRIPFEIPDVDETHQPLFNVRGIQPFHDFTEGPDWWEADDYKAYMTQLAKMRMNFLGLHCYPEGGVGPEPLVWIGLKDDVDADGKVKFSYPSAWASADRAGMWGYASTKTSDFASGAGLLFDEDDFGPSVTRGHRPKPTTPQGSNEVFNRAAAMLRDALTHGRSLGIKICLGTETPLTIPKAVQSRLQEKGLNASDPDTVRKLYEGMFTRISRAYPIDYYWLWTPENWTWRGAKQQQVDATVRDLKLALEALKNVGSPFGFATCGWVLGPPNNRALFDETLPKDVAISCINRNVGFNWVEPGFMRVTGRPQWAIPWMEDDPAMVVPQLWAGRMRRDAADALAYGCTGLIGIHWRTKILAPNISALAMAAWDQKEWNADLGKQPEIEEPPKSDVHVGGDVANYQKNEIADTDEDPVYRTCRYNVSEYRIKVPNGTYNVTLKFCEIHYDAADKRVFGATLQGQPIIDRLDVFKKVGKNKPFDATFEKVEVTDEELVLQFVRQVEFPFIAGIVVDGTTVASNQIEGQPFTRKINCGAGKWQDYEADLPAADAVSAMSGRIRDLPCVDFYQDWTQAWFGPEVAKPAAELFTRLDGDAGAVGVKQGRATLPRPATWIAGPGGVSVNSTPWQLEKQRYAFVDEMAALRDRVQGEGNLQRFDYWLNTFRFLRTMGEIGCTRGQLDGIMKKVDAQKDPAQKRQLAEQEALPVRIRLARLWEQLMTLQLAVTDTPGGMGTVANLEQHTRRRLQFLDAHDKKLAAILGHALPAEVKPTGDYLGDPRIIVPTKRTLVGENEHIRLKVIVLDKARPADVTVHWRWLGQNDYQQLPAAHIARGVYQVQLPPMQASGIEYCVRAKTSTGTELNWPATAPEIGQTVTCMPGS